MSFITPGADGPFIARTDGMRADVRHPALIAALIVVAAALLRLIFFSGMIVYDDFHYARRAYILSTGQLVPPTDHFGTRVGLVVPAALLYRLVGVSKLSTGAYPLLCSLMSVIAVYVFGRRLFGARTGLLAAALLAVFPLDILYASALYANTPVTLFVGLGLGLFLLAEQESRRGLYLASGLALGASVLVHESAVVVRVFYPFYALLLARPSRHHALTGLAFAAVVALDPLLQGLQGDARARFRFLGRLASHDAWMDTVLGLSWLVEPFLRVFTEQELGLFPWVVAPVVLVGARRATGRNERAVLLFVTVVTLWVLYGTVSPFSYAPLPRHPRYLAPVVFAAMLLLAHHLVAHRGWRTRVLVTGVLVVSSIACVAFDGGRSRLRPFEEARTVLAQAKADRVVVERELYARLLFAEGFAPRYAVATLEESGTPSGGAFVVVAADGARRRMAAVPGAERVAGIPRPPSLYLALLGNPVVSAFLHATRPQYRARDLDGKARPWTLEIYRVP